MAQIRLAIVGVGNCASALVQGLHYYRAGANLDSAGLLHRCVGGYTLDDVRIVAAFDIDRRKVGRDVGQAIFSPPNCTKVFAPDVPPTGVVVQMGQVLDGVAAHMADYPEEKAFRVADAPPVDVARVLKQTGAEILVSYLPVGSEEAAAFYANAALDAGAALVNCMPAFIASDPDWARRFENRDLPIVGDDIKSQLGATVTHRTLARLFDQRGVKIERTYQLNTGGNTDFLNMLEQSRLRSKRISKTEAVQSQLDVPLDANAIHIGPSDFVSWQKDNKVCFLRLEGRQFGNVPFEMEVRLSVEDSPNSAGVAVDAIRCCKIALDRGIGGPLYDVCAYCMKHPPAQLTDADARVALEGFIADGQADEPSPGRALRSLREAEPRPRRNEPARRS